VRLRGEIIILKIYKKIPWESAWKTDSDVNFFKRIPYSCTNPIQNSHVNSFWTWNATSEKLLISDFGLKLAILM
jgi:hypothetical protein